MTVRLQAGAHGGGHRACVTALGVIAGGALRLRCASSTRPPSSAPTLSWRASPPATTTCSTSSSASRRSSATWLRGLVLYEPDTQLYLLDSAGRSARLSSGDAQLPAGLQGGDRAGACGRRRSRRRPQMPTAYVMGDDPERMDDDAVVAALPGAARHHPQRRRWPPATSTSSAHKVAALPASRWDTCARNSLALPGTGADLRHRRADHPVRRARSSRR